MSKKKKTTARRKHGSVPLATDKAWGDLTRPERVALRRWRMIQLMARGRPLIQVVQAVAHEYEATQRAVRTDWDRRLTWMPDMIQFSHHDMDLVAREALTNIQVLNTELSDVGDSAMHVQKTYKLRTEDRIPVIEDGKKVGERVVVSEDVHFFPAADHNSAVRALSARTALEELRMRIAGIFYNPVKGGAGLDDLTDEQRAMMLEQAAGLFGADVPALADPYTVEADIEGLDMGEAASVDGLGSTPEVRKASLEELLADDEPEEDGDAG